MARIFNNSDITLSVDAQQAIQQAAANVGGIEHVELSLVSFNEEGEMFEVYFLGEEDEDGEREIIFECSFNTDGNILA